MIQGIQIKLLKRTQSGVDWSNRPIYTETEELVDDVLVGEPTTDDIEQALNMFGKRVQYVLAIPKGDAHDWVDVHVVLPEPFAGTYQTIGFPIAGIDANIPLRWNKKVKVERYVEG